MANYFLDDLSTQQQISAIYVGYYGRAADPNGLQYWIDQCQAWYQDGLDAGMSAEEAEQSALIMVAQSFSDQSETAAMYPYLAYPDLADAEDFVVSIYENLFNREPDADGLAYWSGELYSGNVNVGSFILAVIMGANGTDQAVITNRSDVSLYFASEFASQNGNWDGEFDNDRADARAILEGVTDDPATVTEAMALADEVIAQDVMESESDGTTFEIVSESAAGADVMRITGDQDVRIDFTDPDNQVVGLDLDGDGVIENDGYENNISGVASGYEAVDAYSRNPLNHIDYVNNFLGDIAFDGTGFAGDGTDTDGNIFLGGLGADTAFGGIGNDFMLGGGVAEPLRNVDVNGDGEFEPCCEQFVFQDDLNGGRNADFFFVEMSLLDDVDGTTLDDGNFVNASLDIDGGSTFDDNPLQDSDWLFLEASDDDEPVTVLLNNDVDGASLSITSRDGIGAAMDEVENINASGNLYGFLNDFDVTIGARATDDRIADHVVGEENFGVGTTAQLIIDEGIEGAVADVGIDSVIIAGYDNDTINGRGGDDIIFGGDMQFLATYLNNPNLLNEDGEVAIINDGVDTIFAGRGDDDVVFELDGGTYEGGDNLGVNEGEDDTLWLTDQLFGTLDAETMTEDGVVRIDLGVGQVGGIDNYAGYGGADQGGDALALIPVTADQTNYADDYDFADVQDFENVVATGLGAIDYLAAGANDPDLSFTNQQNYFALGVDLTLRGTVGDNVLYASSGDDILEGRNGDDSLSGGDGNDDFIFAIAGDQSQDGLNVIHRQSDVDGDNIWDVDEDGVVVYEQDFGRDESSQVGESSLNLLVEETDAVGNELANITVTEITSVIFDDAGNINFTLNTPEIKAADTYEDLLIAVQDAIAADSAIADTLTASLLDNVIVIEDAQGREMADEESEGAYFGVSANNVEITVAMEFGDPDVQTSEDRLVFASYEDRADGELVDDDGTVNRTGDAVSLGPDGYAEDLVVRFDSNVDSDGNGTTVLAEDQQWDLEFVNLADEDTVNISVNGTAFSLQMGVAADGTAIQETMAGFLQRMTDLINAGSDNDTLAGTLVAAFDGVDTISLTQGDYNGGQVAFMDMPVVTLGNASGGEAASVTVDQPNTDTEVTLYEFDGTDGNLNSDNVLFLGGSGMDDGEVTNADNSRSILETGADEGGDLIGSDAMVFDTMDDADDEAVDFSLHGDDLLITGEGDDNVVAGTGDDRIYGSEGDDTVDGGKDIYVVQTLVDGEVVETVEELNTYDAAVTLADADVVAVDLLRENAAPGAAADGFSDTLVFSTADFEGTQFTITVDDDLQQENGGAGTVGVDENDDGTIDHLTTFTEMEAIRTLAGDGTHAGQGNDTLDVEALSDAVAGSDAGDPDAAVIYNMTSDLGFISINADLNDDDEIEDYNAAAGNNTADEISQFLAVDGVERLIGGDANETLNIDEAEVNKDNYFDGNDEVTVADDNDPATLDDPDLVGDSIVYNHLDMNNDGAADDDGDIDTNNDGFVDFNDDVSVSMRPALDIVIEAENETDTVNMTGGTIIGRDVTVDTLVDVETIDIANAAISPTLDDDLDLTNVDDAFIDFTNQEVREDNDEVMARFVGMTEIENVLGGDGDDTVEIADNMANYRAYDSNDATTAITYNSFLNYDTVEIPSGDRQTLSDLDVDDRPEANNQALFSFDLGDGDDRVDYSLETGNIAAVVELDDADQVSQTVFVMGNDLDLNDADDRIDLILNSEEVVASQAQSILDFTGANEDIEITFQYDDNDVVAEFDRLESTIRIADGDGNTIEGIGSFVEYYDMDEDDDVAAFANATWNNIQGSDFGETVIYEGTEDLVNEAGLDHRFTNDTLSLRGGDNDVVYSALETSITAVVTVVESDADDEVVDGDGDIDYTTGSIHAQITFQDGEGAALAGAGVHDIFSYTSDNDVAAGTLKLEATQDSEDSVLFNSDSGKVYILGTSSGVLDVQIGDLDAMRLTGFEFLVDSDTDDFYQFDSLITGIQYQDNAAADTDTIGVNNDARGYDDGVAPVPAGDVIDLAELNAGIGIDFDILDVTEVTAGSTELVGTNGAEDETVVLDDLSLFDSIDLFETIQFAAGTDLGGAIEINLDDNEITSGANTIDIDDNLQTVDFSLLDSDIEITVVDEAGAGIEIIGGDGDEDIIGGSGDDVIAGNDGDDVIDGGVEIDEIQTLTLAGTALDPAADFSLTFGDAATAVIDEGDEIPLGGDVDQIGQAIADYDWSTVTFDHDNNILTPELEGDDLFDVTYDAINNDVIFEFDPDYENVLFNVLNIQATNDGAGDVLVDGTAANAIAGAVFPNSDAFQGNGDDIFYGGQGDDDIYGGSGDDTFVVVGEVEEDEYAAVGALQPAANFAAAVTAIVDGQDDSDIDEDIMDGGAGNDTLDIWGDVDFTGATVTDFEDINIHSTVTFTAEQVAGTTFTTQADSVVIIIDGDGVEHIFGGDEGQPLDELQDYVDSLTPNTAPVVNDQAFTVLENSAALTDVGTVEAADAEDDDLTYRLTEADGETESDQFNIDDDGNITVALGADMDLDPEEDTDVDLMVFVSDGEAETSADVTITIENDPSDDPAVNNPPVVEDQTFTVLENSAAFTNVGQVVADDIDGDDLTYTLFEADGETESEMFTINPNSGTIRVANGADMDLDPEVDTDVDLVVSVTDGLATDTADVTVTIENDPADDGGAAIDVDVTAANDGETYNADDAVQETFIFDEGDYAYTIDNFEVDVDGNGDILDMPDVPAPTINNPDFNDGECELQWASGGQVLTVTLTGLPVDVDGGLLFPESFGDSLV